MGFSLEEAKALGIDVSKLKLRDKVQELYGSGDSNKTITNSGLKRSGNGKYGTNLKGHFFNGMKFKSDLEIKRYQFLTLSKQIGIIKDFFYEFDKFVLQEGFKFQGETYNIITYTPDFKVILNNGKIVYEDTKSKQTSKNSTYKVKSKLFVKKYLVGNENLYFREVFEAEENYFNSL